MPHPIRDIHIDKHSNIYDLIESIVKRAENQPIPVRISWDETANFVLTCSTAVFRLRLDIEAKTFDIKFIREYMLTYYGERGETERRRLYIQPELAADLDVINQYMEDNYTGIIDQWVIKGDLFAHRGGKINLSFIIPLAIMWLEQQTQSLEPAKS